MTNPTDRHIISQAIELLRAGLLPSAVPARLMAEFKITSVRARRLAGAAVKEWKAE